VRACLPAKNRQIGSHAPEIFIADIIKFELIIVMILHQVLFQFFLRVEDHTTDLAFELSLSFGSGACHYNTSNRGTWLKVIII
jgi:hypothetical protein